MNVNDCAASLVRSDALFDSLTMRVEHGWLCIRTETGWLAESFELAKFPGCGVSMADLKAMCERNLSNVNMSV